MSEDKKELSNRKSKKKRYWYNRKNKNKNKNKNRKVTIDDILKLKEHFEQTF
jgi:hypothetical protein